MNDGMKPWKPMSGLNLAPRQKPAELKPIAHGAAKWAPISRPAPRQHIDDIFAPPPERKPERKTEFKSMAHITADSFRNLRAAAAELQKPELRSIASSQLPPPPASAPVLRKPEPVAAPVPKQVRAPIPVASPTPLRKAPVPIPAPLKAAAPTSASSAVQAPANANESRAPGAKLNESFGALVQALAETARYRHVGVGELVTYFFEPLQRDRVAIALAGPSEEEARSGKPAAFMVWANVSPEVDEKIREQISAGMFPIRLKPEDWTSGDVNWLFDVVASTPQMRSAALASFVQSKRLGELRLHPMINRLIDAEQLEKIGLAPKPEEPRKTA